MRRSNLLFSLCLVMLFNVVVNANSAGRILVNADNSLAVTTISLQVQDSEISSVIAALFNATDNKYQARISNGISGVIDELSFDNLPFDAALDAVLKKVNEDYTYAKISPTVYRIKAPAEAIVAPSMVMMMPTKVDDSLRMIKTMLPPIKKTTDTTTPPVTLPGEDVTPVEEPTAEECILAVLKIRYIDVPSLCDALGYQYMESFTNNQNNNNGSGTRNNNRNNRNNNNNQYDAYGNLINNNNQYDANGNLINNNNNQYDANGRLINNNNNNQYDANGRLINNNNNNQYDANGRLINNNNNQYYDANGRLIR